METPGTESHLLRELQRADLRIRGGEKGNTCRSASFQQQRTRIGGWEADVGEEGWSWVFQANSLTDMQQLSSCDLAMLLLRTPGREARLHESPTPAGGSSYHGSFAGWLSWGVLRNSALEHLHHGLASSPAHTSNSLHRLGGFWELGVGKASLQLHALVLPPDLWSLPCFQEPLPRLWWLRKLHCPQFLRNSHNHLWFQYWGRHHQ